MSFIYLIFLIERVFVLRRSIKICLSAFVYDLYTVYIKLLFLKKFWIPPRSAGEIPLHEKLTTILCYFLKESLMPIEK